MHEVSSSSLESILGQNFELIEEIFLLYQKILFSFFLIANNHVLRERISNLRLQCRGSHCPEALPGSQEDSLGEKKEGKRES